MKMSSAIANNSIEPIAILSVSPATEDHSTLEDIFRHQYISTGHQDCKLELVTSWTLQKAIVLLRMNYIPIAICERDLRPGDWQEFLEHAAFMPHLPLVIVTSRLADERLWAEALNLGAWDVLAKPFDRIEVIRVVESAWLQFKARRRVHQTSMAAG